MRTRGLKNDRLLGGLFKKFCQKKQETCLVISNRYRSRKAAGFWHDKPDVYRSAIADVLPAIGSKKSISIPIAIPISIKPYPDKRCDGRLFFAPVMSALGIFLLPVVIRFLLTANS